VTKALVIIDVQKGMFSVGVPYEGERVVAALVDLLAKARAADAPVFFVQHEGGEGHPLARDGEGFAFHETLSPQPGEDITIKRHCSAFQKTDFFEKLTAAGINEVVIGGMQTEFCIDTAVRGAFERGLKVTLLADGHTTFDTPALPAAQIIAHHNHTLKTGQFARLVQSADLCF